jgi:hypothetical protein
VKAVAGKQQRDRRDDRLPSSPVWLRRLLLAAASAFIAINMWTGAPVLALWVGSAAVGQQQLSMAAVFLVVVVLAGLELGLLLVLIRVNAAHDELTGREKGERRLTWLSSMNTQGQDQGRAGIAASTPERIVVLSVYVAVITLLVWFFGFAGSPLAG